MTNILS